VGYATWGVAVCVETRLSPRRTRLAQRQREHVEATLAVVDSDALVHRRALLMAQGPTAKLLTLLSFRPSFAALAGALAHPLNRPARKRSTIVRPAGDLPAAR
jgi:hypothetical protein